MPKIIKAVAPIKKSLYLGKYPTPTFMDPLNPSGK
jgi:hypothetical protein